MVNTQKGATFLEGIIAAGIITFGGLALGTSFYKVVQTRTKTQTVATAVAFESAILRALNDTNTFTEAQRQQMSRGEMPSLSLTLPDFPNATLPVDGQAYCFNRQGTRVSATSFDDSSCNFMAQVAIMLEPASNSFRVAYRIDVNPNLVQVGRMGEMSGTNGFDASDYSHAISIQNYASDVLSQCGPGELGVKAFNRDTGQVVCFNRPQLNCPDGTLPKSLYYTTSTGGAGSVELECESSQSIGCPSNYSLRGFVPASFDRRNPKSGTCVYTAKTQDVWPVTFRSARGFSLIGLVCPQNYVFTTSGSTCSINPATVTSTNGTCEEDSWALSCGAWEVDPGDSTRERRWCDYKVDGTRSVAASPGTASFVPRPNPREAFCQLQIPRQTCGSTWNAGVQMRINCRLTLPESMPAL